MDAIIPILQHAMTVSPEELPDDVVASTKRFILDTLGVMIAGTRAAGCADVASYAAQWRGTPAATLMTGLQAPAPYAALANGMMAHAIEFDDTYEPGDVHAYCVVLPAVLAIAESHNVGQNGRHLITATAVGVDIAYRMASAIRRYRGWHPTATCGIMGATVAAGLVAGLGREELHHAAGIAYSLVSGTFQPVVDVSLAKRMQPGFAARGAVDAVMFARSGLTGPRDILEGVFGFYPLLESGEYEAEILTEGLGVRYLGEQGSMKPYPCCRFCHAAIDAALAIAENFGGHDEEERLNAIDVVEIEIPIETFEYVGREFGNGPDPRIDAQFSVAYTVASALVRRRVGIGDFSLESVRDGGVRALTRRTKIATANTDRYGPSKVKVRLRSGAIIERVTNVMKGQPENPLTDAELLEKVRSCIAFAGWDAGLAERLATWAGAMDRSAEPTKELFQLLDEGRRG